MRMLDVATMGAAALLMVYALYAAKELVPAKRLIEAIALDLLAGVVCAVGWEAYYGRVPWSCSALVIALAVMVTVWRHEARVFVQCKLGEARPANHPRRRATDLHEAAGRR
jgi:hypothetical protein